MISRLYKYPLILIEQYDNFVTLKLNFINITYYWYTME